jgi:O-antigen/teichoic acid export membrane protein
LSGNVLAQLIPLVLSPVLSRLYSPEQFGELALLMNIVNPLAVIACLKYDAAIVIPKEETAARDLLRLSLRLALISALVSFALAELVLLFLHEGSWLVQKAFVLRLVAPTVLLIGVATAINYWLQRQMLFRAIAIFKLVQMCAITFISLAWIYILTGNGLTLGYTLGWAIVTIITVYYLLVRQKFTLGRENRQFNYMKTYARFPLYNGIPEFLNTIALSVPVFVFFHQFGDQQAGYLNLCRQVLYFPASFIAVSLSQYYYQEFSVHFREQKKLLPVVRKIVFITLPIALLMVMVTLLAGPPLFAFVFGAKWLVSGYYAQILVAVFSIQLISLPLQTMFTAIGKNYLFGLFKILSFAVNITLMGFGYASPAGFLYIYVLCEGTVWLASAICTLYFAYIHDQTLKQA